MADIKISQLPVASVVNDNDIAVINQGGDTKTAAKSLIVAGLATTDQISAFATTSQVESIASAQIAAITPASIGAFATSAIIGIGNGGTGATDAPSALAALGGITSAQVPAFDSAQLSAYVQKAGSTMEGRLIMAATTAQAKANIGGALPGVAAPTSSIAGDVWVSNQSRLTFSPSTGVAVALAGTSQANTFNQTQTIGVGGTVSSLVVSNNGTGRAATFAAASTAPAVAITQTGAGEAFRVEDETSPDATPFVISASGRVGIGVTPDAVTALAVDAGGIKFNDGSIQTTAVGSFSTAQLSGYATTTDIQGIAFTSQLAGFATTDQISGFTTSAQVQVIASAQISTITPASIGALSTSDVIQISQGGTGEVTSTAALTALGGMPLNQAAGGDLSGTYPDPSVVKLRGYDISTNTPFGGAILQWIGTEWTPATPPSGSVTSVGTGAGLTGGPITSDGIIALETTGVAALTYGSATQVAVLDVNQFGQITSASNAAITPAGIGALSTDAASGFATTSDIQGIAFTSQLSAFATTSQLSGYATTTDIQGIAFTSQLAAFTNSAQVEALASAQIAAITPGSIGAVATSAIIAIGSGGTGSTDAVSALAALGAAALESPAFTGTPTAPTAAAQTNTTQIATTAFVLSNSGDRYLTTSTTENTITNGAKTFTVASGLSYTATQDITIVYDANNHMHGSVTSYSGTTLVVDIVQHSQTSPGPYTQWTINVGGLTNTAGTLLSANNLSDVASPSTSLTNLGGVSTARTISAGTGLSGGGDLTANRTLSLADTAVTAGSYGSSTQVAALTVDAQGRLTAASNQAISASGIGAQPALTSAAPAAIEQGGTGATTAVAALSNLGGISSSALEGYATTGQLSGFATTSQLSAYQPALTSAAPAAIEQGGTGATDAVSALANLGGITTAALSGYASTSQLAGLQPALTTAAPLGIELGGTGATTAIAAMTNLGSLHFAGGWSQTSVITGTMDTGVTPNTFTVTATGVLSVDGGAPLAGDIVVFASQPTASQHFGRDNGPWIVVNPGAVGVQATFVRPDWFSGTVKNGILVTNQYGTARTGFTYAMQGPINTTSGNLLDVGTDIISILSAYSRNSNAVLAANSFTGRQTFPLNSATVNPISFSTAAPTLLSTRLLGAVEWDNQQLYITSSTQFALLNRNPIATATVLINAQTGTSYTPVLADAGKLITASNAAAISLTIPTDATTDFPVGTQLIVMQLAAGQVTVSAATPGTTAVNSKNGTKTSGQYAVISLIKVAANSWVVGGDATT